MGTVQQYIGRHPLHAETNEIRHVGNAMVVFKKEHVAPLYIADMAENHDVVYTLPLRPNTNRVGALARAGCRKCWDFEAQEAVWLPPEEYRGAINLKRRYQKRLRELHRKMMR